MCKYIKIQKITYWNTNSGNLRLLLPGVLWQVYGYMFEPSDADNDEDNEDCNCFNCHQRPMLPGAPWPLLLEESQIMSTLHKEDDVQLYNDREVRL